MGGIPYSLDPSKGIYSHHLKINYYVQNIGGLGLNGIKLKWMAIENIKILASYQLDSKGKTVWICGAV